MREKELEEGVADIKDFWGLFIVKRESSLRAALWSLLLLLFWYFVSWYFRSKFGAVHTANHPIR